MPLISERECTAAKDARALSGKEYVYKKLSFTTASKPLGIAVYEVLAGMELNPRLCGRDKRDVRLENQAKVRRYFETIGTSNPKHLKRLVK